MPKPETVTIQGWKTKVGAVLVALSGGLFGGAQMAPSPEIAAWCNFAAAILGGMGLSLLGVGVGHKIEKAAAQPKAYLVKQMPERWEKEYSTPRRSSNIGLGPK